MDGLGDVYVTGESTGNSTGLDYTTIKYNAYGIQVWIARYNEPANGDDRATSIFLDLENNIYVSGESEGIGSGFDCTTIKYNENGLQKWVARYNGPINGYDIGVKVKVDTSRKIYVIGSTENLVNNFDYLTIVYDSSGNQR